MSDIQVSVALSTGTHVFDSANGVNQGDYVSPYGFTQHNLKVSDPAIPFTVFFRSDADSSRDEVVLEWGDIWNTAPSHLAAYVATITKDGVVVATVSVPHHWWLSRWRWQSAARTVKGTLPTWLSGLDSNVSTEGPLTAAQVVPYSPMGFAGCTPYMPQTGERNEIGIVTNCQAEYLATGNTHAFDEMMAQAEASGSWGWHTRDSATGAATKWENYPLADTYDNQQNQGPPKVNMLGVGAPDNVTPDMAHHPGLEYLPFKLTGDPYFLEEMQLSFSWLYGNKPNPQVMVNGFRTFRIDQVRGYAWMLRSLIQLADMTPDMTPNTMPSWLLPKSYYVAMLDAQRVWFETNVTNATDPFFTVFNGTFKLLDGSGNTVISFWQEDYLATTLGVACLMGFHDWAASFLFKVRSTIARVSGAASWPRTCPSFYWAIYKPVGGVAAADWGALATLNGLTPAAPAPGDVIDWTKTDADYAADARGALAVACRLGVADAAAPFAYIDPQVCSHYLTRRWAFASM